MKQIWQRYRSIDFSPVLFKRINGWLTIIWILMIPISIATGWISSVPFISAISIYALITGHLSTWQASRVEVKQDEQENGS
jgi:hypothetical protein